jgi:hypothetical protein
VYRPGEYWFVGDGGSREHHGARAAGMRPVLVTNAGYPGASVLRDDPDTQLATVRRDGIAYSRGEYVNGVICVAVLVARESARRPAVAVSVSGRANDFDLSAARAQLPRTALAISGAIREATARVPHLGVVHSPAYATVGVPV